MRGAALPACLPRLRRQGTQVYPRSWGPSTLQTPLLMQHLLAGMKRAKREEDGDETPSQKRQRMGK